MSLDRSELQEVARAIWGTLSENDAALLNRLGPQIGRAEMALRLRALAHRVVKGDIDPPSAGVWLTRQRPGRGHDP